MDFTEFKFGTLRCQVTDEGWLTIKQDIEQGHQEQDIGVGKIDGKRFKALNHAIEFMKDKFANQEKSEVKV